MMTTLVEKPYRGARRGSVAHKSALEPNGNQLKAIGKSCRRIDAELADADNGQTHL